MDKEQKKPKEAANLFEKIIKASVKDKDKPKTKEKKGK